MKPNFFLTIAFSLWMSSVFAQNSENNEESLKQDEIPVAILKSYQKDFGNPDEKGNWELFYIEDLGTQKLTPEFYRYTIKKNGERVEYFYKPDGKLYRTKGTGKLKKSRKK